MTPRIIPHGLAAAVLAVLTRRSDRWTDEDELVDLVRCQYIEALDAFPNEGAHAGDVMDAASNLAGANFIDEDLPSTSVDDAIADLDRAITAHVEAEVARRLAAAPGVEAAIDNLRRVDRQSYASGGVESVWPARKALLAAIAADRARAVAEAVDLDAIALAADLIGRHLAPTSDVARGAVARLEAMLAGKPARPTPDEKRRLLDEYDRATRHSYVTGGPEHLRAARAALLRALGVEA